MKLTREKRGTRGKTCPSATLSNTNSTWTYPGIEPEPPQWEAGDYRLSRGKASFSNISINIFVLDSDTQLV
jgi:hypothetical protein